MRMEDTQPLEEYAVRLNKLTEIRNRGIDPYPSASARTHTVAQIRDTFAELETAHTEVTITGRLKAVRGHGGACFADIEDGTGKIQAHLRRDMLPEGEYAFFED